MREYLDLMRHVLEHGERKSDRTGTGTLSVFGHQMRVDLERGFPLLTTKKVHLKSIVHELLWFLKGDTNIGLPAREQRYHLGRVGRRRRQPRPRLRRAVAAEAGIGSVKGRAFWQAALHDRLGEWTCDDLEAARRKLNETHRPWGQLAPTPEQAWSRRTPLDTAVRAILSTTVSAYREDERRTRGVRPDAARQPAE